MVSLDRKIRNILLKKGLIDEEQAENAANNAQAEACSLGKALLEMEAIKEPDYLGALSEETNLPAVNLGRVEFEEVAVKSLPEDMAKYYCVLPIAKIGNILTLAVSDPFDILKLDDIRIVTGCDIRPVIATEGSILKEMPRAYNPGQKEMESLIGTYADPEMALTEATGDEEDIDLASLSEAGGDSPIVKLVNLIIFQGIRDGASDIHVEPFEKKVRVRYRVDGILHEALAPLPRKMLAAMTSRLKIMSDLDIAERRKPQDGKFQLRVEGRQIDFRVSILPTIHGEKTVMRILDSSGLSRSLDKLGWEEETIGQFRHAIEQPFGMILVTGPTGSGKSTTLYSALKEIKSDADNIVTVEDPVEYQLDGIVQVPINPKRGLTFAAALRSILRQDPDKIMVGEIRDLETVEIAIKAALTGHLVLSTLHTNDSVSTITRLVDMGVDPFLVGSSVLLVSAQRLARRLCKDCKEPVSVPGERLRSLGFGDEEIDQGGLFHAVGCRRCVEGYKGRFAIMEALLVSDEIKKMIVEGSSELDLKKRAVGHENMVTLRKCGIRNAVRGITSIEEVLRVTTADER